MAGSTTNYGATKPAVGEAYDVNISNGNADIFDTQIFNRAKQALGNLAGSKSRSSASAAVSALSIIENIASIAFKGGRKYRIVWDFSYTMSVATDVFTLGIHTCSTADSSSLTTGLTDLVSRVFTVPAASQGTQGILHAYYEPVSDTTLQVKFSAVRTFGSGTFTMEGAKSWFIVEDLGAQY